MAFALHILLLLSVFLSSAHNVLAEPPLPKPVLDKPVANFCGQMRKRLPRMDERACVNAGLKLNGGNSIKGTPIFYHETEQREEKNKPLRVLLIGGIHGDELTAPEIVLNWIARLGEADAARYHWKAVPLLNPDGFFSAQPQRVNANGVDLNRNFPTTDWATKAKHYWENQVKRDPRRYPGKAPLSEPESRWLSEQLDSFKPDAIVSVHAPLGVLDFDGPAPAPRRIGRLYLDQVGVYPGSLGNYSGIQRGVPVVTLELPHSFNMPTAFEQDRMWRDMISWLKQRSSLMDKKS